MSNYQSLSQGYLSPCGYFKVVEYPVVQFMCMSNSQNSQNDLSTSKKMYNQPLTANRKMYAETSRKLYNQPATSRKLYN
jgi:hypothetical protein